MNQQTAELIGSTLKASEAESLKNDQAAFFIADLDNDMGTAGLYGTSDTIAQMFGQFAIKNREIAEIIKDGIEEGLEHLDSKQTESANESTTN